MLAFLNIFFFVFHTALVLFNLLGWMYPRTRRLNLFTLTLTAFSWFVMGIWYGWGYCVCTHWHWQIRSQLGYSNHSPTYIHLLLLQITGKDFPVRMVEWITGGGFVIALIGTLWTNFRDWKNRRRTLQGVQEIERKVNHPS